MKNEYYLKARLFPTVLTAPPILLFYNKFIAAFYEQNLAAVFEYLPTITNVTLSGAIIFLLVQINRVLAKEIFQWFYFCDEERMPTTNYLLKSNGFFEKRIRQKIEDKIDADYGIKLLSLGEEKKDEHRARQVIMVAVSRIRNSLRENKMLFQHNIEYGFVRNFMGGALLALIAALGTCVLAYLENEKSIMVAAALLGGAYIITLIFSKFIIQKYGAYYAKILYEQFLTTP